MEFKLKGNNNYKENALETIFINRGVENAKSLLEVDVVNTIHYSKLKNIELAVNAVIGICSLEDAHIFVQVDSDADGYTSASVLIMELQRLFPHIKITWRIHKGKEHGVIVNTVPEDAQLVIIPDAGSNQVTELKELCEKGYVTVVLDHHKAEPEVENYAFVVNPQLSAEYENKELSGVGVVYKFIKALGEKLGDDNSDHYLDLVAIGNIGDMVDLRSKETRYYVKTGLEQINNPLMKALIEKQDFSMGGIINITTIAFYIVPLINACIRAGKPEEKENMFKAMIGSNETIYYKRNDVDEHITVAVARNLTNIRTRQNKPLQTYQAKLEEVINSMDIENEKVFILEVGGLDNKLTGLLANRISRKYRRPTILVREKDGELRGSARGYETGEIKDFSEFLINSNLGIKCMGHSNSMGCMFNKAVIDELKDYIKENTKCDINMKLEIVDFIIEQSELNNKLILDVAKYRDEWGSTLTEPVMGLSKFLVRDEDIQLMGKYKNVLKIKIGDIEMIKPFFNKEKYDELFDGSLNYVIDFTCKFKTNEYKGKITPQIQIEDIDVIESFDF